MQSLVDGGLEEGLNERNSTMLVWVTMNFGSTPSSTSQTYNYFSGSDGYFTNGYAGYYVGGFPPFYTPYNANFGIINLKTGKMEVFDGYPNLPTVDELLAFADEANQ